MAESHLNGEAPVVNILSLNCWGLKYISKYRVERLNEIASRIACASPSYDIVALQECWVYDDYLNIRQKTDHILPAGKFYFSGAIGGGLVILSKWPIVQTSMFRYPLNGRPTAFFRGDYYVGKGVAHAAIKHPTGKTIDVFNTHLHAPYEEKDTYLCHRTAQAWEMAKLLRSSVQKRNIVFGCGDFNMLPSSLAHRIISTHGLVADSWLSAYPKTLDTNPPGASARFNIENLGVTCDSVINTWRAAGHETPSLETVDPFGKRLDYVFHSPEQSSVRSISVGMTKPMLIPGSKGVTCSVSDHFSIELQLALAPCPEQQRAFALAKAQGPVPINTQINVSRPVNGPINKLDLQTPSTKIEEYLDDSIVEAILAVFQEYYRREVKEKKWRIRHFFFSVAALVPLSIGIWWSPHNAISFAIMLASLVIVVTGILDGLIGFIFTGSEIRALKEFEAELITYRQLVASQ